MKNLSILFSALVALLFSVAETSAQITPPYYNPANVNITGGTINGTTVGETTPANTTTSRLRIGASNDLYLTRYAAKQMMISGDGVGATTNAGIIAGYYGTSGNSAIWSSAFTPDASNYILFLSSTAVTLNGGTSANLNVANNNKFSSTSTLNTSTNPLAVTDTTDSSSTTTGSLRTAGGLGVAKKSYYGDSLYPGVTRGLITWGNAGINGGAVFSIYGQATQWLALGAEGTDGVALVKSTGLTVADGKTLQVGSGSTTSAGLIAGYFGSSGYGAIWSTGVTPSTTNHSFATNGTTTGLNATSSTVLNVSNSNRLIATATSITHAGDMIYDKTITAAGTTGAQTINKTSGRVNFAAAATSLVVTNSLATANSICHVTKATNDATMRLGACVAAAGSITIYADVAPAAETAVNFTVTN